MSRVTGSPPLFTGSTANQRAIIDGNAQPMPPAYNTAAMYSSRVESAALPPAYDTSPSSAAPTMVAAAGQVATVQPGDTLYSIARRHGVSVDALAAANSISDASHLPVGRQLVIPASGRAVAAAPQVLGAPPRNLGTVSESDIAAIRTAAPQPIAAAPASTAPSGQHVVATGDTVYSIARRYNVRASDLTAANGLVSANQIRIGQRLTIPGAGTGQVAAAAPARPQQTAALTNPRIANDATPAPVASQPQAAAPTPPPLPAVPTKPVQVGADGNDGPSEYTPPRTPTQQAALQQGVEPPSADGTSFRWPVRGRIISSFGTKPNGERNDGINLAVPEGTAVKAAEAGTVIYSGNEIAGYGNLILIRHANGWVSAYAHNKTNGVKRGDTVSRGQNIAEAGQSGTVNSPQLHFELRKGSDPVNPLDHLAGA